MIRTLRITRRSAVKARAQAANQLQALLITAPEGLKSELCQLSTARVVEKASRLRPGATPSDVEAATKCALRSVARRHQRLSEEISELDEQLDRLVSELAPELVEVEGIGTDTAASLLIAALKTTPSGSRTRQPSRTCAGPHRSRPLRERGSAIV